MSDACNDAWLVAKIQRGDVAALAEVYEAHAGRVFSLARRILHDAQSAEKVVEDVFVRLWDESERFDERQGSLRAHLLCLARTRSHELLAGLDGGHPPEGEPGRHPPFPREVDVLPEDETRAIELAYFGGHSCLEIAELLGVPADAVHRRIRRGLKRVRLAMPEDQDG